MKIILNIALLLSNENTEFSIEINLLQRGANPQRMICCLDPLPASLMLLFQFLTVIASWSFLSKFFIKCANQKIN